MERAPHGDFKAGTSNYKAPASKSTTLDKYIGTDGDNVGVGSGLSALSEFDAENPLNPVIDNDRDPVSGNATERASLDTKNVTGKGSSSFNMC